GIMVPPPGMNVLGDEKKQQVLALGRLGWSARRIHATVGVDRKTIKRYLAAAGIAVRAPGGAPAEWPPPNAATSEGVSTDSGRPNAATSEGVSTDCAARQWPPSASRAPAASACEVYRELIEDALGRGRNAMAIYQEL